MSSREAATHPSSVEPPSHIPAKAAMLLQKLRLVSSVHDIIFALRVEQRISKPIQLNKCYLVWPSTQRLTIFRTNARFRLLWIPSWDVTRYMKREKKSAPCYRAALRYIRRSQSLTPGIQTSSSCCVTESPSPGGNGCSSGSFAWQKGRRSNPTGC